MGENLFKQSKRQGELRHFILWGVRKVSELGVLFFGSFVFLSDRLKVYTSAGC